MMITKKWLCGAVMLGAITLFTQHVYAQSTQDAEQQGIRIGVGIKGGASVVRLPFSYTEERFVPVQTTDYNANLGVQAGVFAEIDFGFVSVQPEILYSRQGGSVVQDGGSRLSTRYVLDYIQIPLLAKFRASSGWLGYIGPQIGYLFQAKTVRENANAIIGGGTKVQIYAFDEDGEPMITAAIDHDNDPQTDRIGVLKVIEENILDYFDVLDLSLVIGGGYEFSNGLGVDIRYSLGFFDPISENMRVEHFRPLDKDGDPMLDEEGRPIFIAAAPLGLVTEAHPLGITSITSDSVTRTHVANDADDNPIYEIRNSYRPDAHDQVSARNHLFQLSISYKFKLK